MSARKFIQKKVYRWHRVTGLIVALPILLWSLSGFLHPVMNSFKPNVRNQFLPSSTIDTSTIKLPLQKALQQNTITAVRNFRIVSLDGAWYYQIHQLKNDTLTYVSCVDGKPLKNGDKLYASYLAQRYLSEPVTTEKQNTSHGHQLAADMSFVRANFRVQKTFLKSKITSIDLITKFDKEYKPSNVLLPVYKVRFDRDDGIRLYIETSTGRLAAAMDDKKAWFTRFFGITHSWNFLDGLGRTKQVILGLLSVLCFVSSLLGFYVYNIIQKKRTQSTSNSWHRTLGNIFVFTTALYGISGAWHAFHKLSEGSGTSGNEMITSFSSTELALSLPVMLRTLHHSGNISDVSIVKMYNQNYWQLTVADGKHKYRKYFNTKTGNELMHGDVAYGRFLACFYSGNSPDKITHSETLTTFTNSYSMRYKRLPVMEVLFKDSKNYYVETTSGRIAAITGSHEKAERFSFSNLHMHHYWEHWFGPRGKAIQKSVLVSTTLGLLLLALTGCRMYWKKRINSKKRKQ